ncbi:MAG: hypothetical protein IKV62_01565 [Bacteroidales bacterium]|nr:hypothetical protein [Bacteroidales bacterium]
MKRLIIFGCLAGALACAACERLTNPEVSPKEAETVVRQGDVVFSLDEVARLFAALPVGEAQVAEVRDAVSASTENGYDEEYTLKNLFEAPGSGIGSNPATRVEAYPEPLRDMLAAEVRRQFGTRAMDPEAFLDALSASDVQIYWPFSEDFTSAEAPIVTFNPGDNSSRNVGYLRREDGTLEEIVVDEEVAQERPVWVVNRNIDAEYQSLEMLRRENPDWGQGGSIVVGSGSKAPTRASGKDFKTLVLRSFKSNRNFDSWLAGGSEIWVKCGAIEDFCASTEAELRLYTPSITDFLIVVKRKNIGKVLTFNAVLVSEWTGMLDNCAFMMVEDDGGSQTSWKCSAMVKYNSRSYGFEIEIPLRSRDDIIWRGALTRSYIEKYNGVTGHFGDVDLVLELI